MNSGNNIVSKSMYKSIIDAMPYGVLVADIAGKFILWNTVSYTMFKKELVDSKQENWVDDWGVYAPDKLTKYNTDDVPLSRALRGETVVGEKLFLLKADMPQGIFIKVSAFPILNDKSEIEAGIVVCEDITKEQQLYEEVVDKINEFEVYIRGVLGFKQK